MDLFVSGKPDSEGPFPFVPLCFSGILHGLHSLFSISDRLADNSKDVPPCVEAGLEFLKVQNLPSSLDCSRRNLP